MSNVTVKYEFDSVFTSSNYIGKFWRKKKGENKIKEDFDQVDHSNQSEF